MIWKVFHVSSEHRNCAECRVLLFPSSLWMHFPSLFSVSHIRKEWWGGKSYHLEHEWHYFPDTFALSLDGTKFCTLASPENKWEDWLVFTHNVQFFFIILTRRIKIKNPLFPPLSTLHVLSDRSIKKQFISFFLSLSETTYHVHHLDLYYYEILTDKKKEEEEEELVGSATYINILQDCRESLGGIKKGVKLDF